MRLTWVIAVTFVLPDFIAAKARDRSGEGGWQLFVPQM